MTMTPHTAELTIRAAEERDVPAIQQVAREAWEQTYAEILGRFDRREIRSHMVSERSLLEDIGRHSSHFLVATVDDAVVGFGELVAEGGSGEVARIAVLPQWQRHGIATSILCRGMELLSKEGVREVTTGVEAEDEACRAFFERHGFHTVREHTSDLEAPELELLEYTRHVPTSIEDCPDDLEVWSEDGRFCPRCEKRYERGVETCPECGVSLVAAAPSVSVRAGRGEREEELEEHRFVQVLRTADESRVSLVSSALEGAGIAFSVRAEEPPNGGQAGIEAPAEIWVAPGRVIEARDVVESLVEGAPLGEEEEAGA